MRLSCDSDSGIGHRARLGLIVLHVDETVEPECRRLLDLDGVALYCTRIRSGTEVTPETLQDMVTRLPDVAALLPPATAFDVVAYACTSAATVIGPGRVAELIRLARPGNGPDSFVDTAITDPLTAAKAACDALGIRRLGLVSPYIERVSAAVRDAFEADGLSISASGSFEQAEEYRVARIDPQSVLEAIVRVGEASSCEGVFVSCTNLRTLDVLQAAEDRLGVPVISSNQALAWHMLRSAGVQDCRTGLGRLFLQ